MISAGNVDCLWHEHGGEMLTGNGKTILETRGARCSETSEQPNVSILRENTKRRLVSSRCSSVKF